MLDIRNGDYLVVNGREYPVRAVSEWTWDYGNAMRRLLRITANTKRQEAIAGGKRGELVDHLLGIRGTPLDPVDPETRQRLNLTTPHTLLQTFVDGGNAFYHLIVEDLKR